MARSFKLTVRIDMPQEDITYVNIDSAYAPIPNEFKNALIAAVMEVTKRYKNELYTNSFHR